MSSALQIDPIKEIIKCEQRVKLKQKDLIAHRFDQGRWIAEAYDLGMSTNEIFDKTKIAKTTIRECYRFYTCPQFGGDRKLLDAWLVNGGKALYWRDVQALIKSDSDPTVVTQEEWVRRGIRYVERAGEKIEEMNEFLQENTGLAVEEEMESAVLAFYHTAQQFAQLMGNDEVIPVDEKYRKRVAGLPCAFTGVSHEDVVAHHVGTEGTGIKTSDYLTIPVRFKVHNELHQYGHTWVEKRYGKSILLALVETLHVMATGRPANLPEHVK